MMVTVLDAGLAIPLALLVFPILGKAHQLGFATYLLFLSSIAMGGMVFAATLLTKGLERALFNTSGRSLIRAGILLTMSCLLPVLLPIIVALGMSPFVTEEIIPGLPTFKGAIPAVLLVPLILVWLANRISLEQRYREEWETLQND